MIQITDEILSKLVGIARANGIDLGEAPDGSDVGDLKPVIPAVNLVRAVSELAHETGLNLKDSGLFIFAKRLVTIGADGKEEEMDSDRFRTWVDQFQLNFNKRRQKEDGPGAPIKATMKADVAKVLLRSDEFLCHIPEIKKLLPVRLPVWDAPAEDGTKCIRLLPYGYDQATQIYTQNTGIEYLDMWTVETATKYLRKLLKDFPFGDPGRSLAVQISGMMTTYCQLLFAPLDNLPMIFFNANQPGSGKSRLAEMIIYAIWGEADPLSYSDNDEFVKKLDTWAQTGLGYMFLDDVSGLVKNNDLNRWLSSPTWSGRFMHSQKKFSVHCQMLTLLTGNQATLSEDLTRRMLMVDFWLSQLPSDRQGDIDETIDAEWLAAPQNRSDILSALHALLKHWVDLGSVSYDRKKLIPSFEGWSRIVPAIVVAAGFDCPLQKPNVQDAGGKQEVEFMRLLEAAARDYTPELGAPVDILLTDWCRLARYAGVFHSVVSDTATMREVMDARPQLYKAVTAKDGTPRAMHDGDRDFQASKYMEKGQSTKFGHMLNKFYRGQVRKINGRTYQFAQREARHSTFALELLAIDDDAPPPPAPPVVDDEALTAADVDDIDGDRDPF